MSHITLDEFGPLLRREIAARRGSLLAIFAVVALVFLVMAFFWQKKYTSFVQLYVDDTNLVSQDLELGLDTNQANVAREELFSSEIMDRILDEIYVDENTSLIERELIRKEIMDDTEIFNINNQLIEIIYEHTDPAVAYGTASRYGDLFLKKTMRTSSEETTEAFDFIVGQVETYRDKLEDAEARLESFRRQYPGISASTEGNVEQRIVELRRDMEEANLRYAEFNQRGRALERELSSESSTIAVEYEASQTRDKVAALQAEIDVLRLSYTDDYPDIIRLQQQIQELLDASARRRAQGAGAPGTANFNLNGRNFSGAASLSPVYQQLRSDLARTTAEAESQRSRASQLKVLLDNEIQRSAVSGKVERQLTELTRDYQINKDLYEDLLRRKESARLTMVLGQEKQGVLYRISQPAVFPVLPTGLRFMHIASAGLLLALVLPFLYLVVFLKLDPRIRTASAVTDVLELPLLTTVPHMSQGSEKQAFFSRPSTMTGVVLLVVALYIAVSLTKVMMAASTQGAV